jgi:hypothetical protein
MDGDGMAPPPAWHGQNQGDRDVLLDPSAGVRRDGRPDGRAEW